MERKFTIFALFYFVFEGKFQVQAPRRAYIQRGDMTEGFLRYDFGGLINGGVYFKLLYYYYCEKPICMGCTVKKLARESAGKAHAMNMGIIIPGRKPFFFLPNKLAEREHVCMRES